MPFSVGDVVILRDYKEVFEEYKELNYGPDGERVSYDFVYLPGAYGFDSYTYRRYCGTEVTIIETEDDEDGIQVCAIQSYDGNQFWTSELMLEPTREAQCGFSESDFMALLCDV